jgi:hypothetical protein
MNDNNSTITFTSPKANNGLPAYPAINIILKFDNNLISQIDKIFSFLDSELHITHVPKIMDSILDVLVKYPPGVLTELTNNTPINIVSEIGKFPFFGIQPAGIYRPSTQKIYVEYDKIAHALQHEIGHAVDYSKFLPALIPGAQSHTQYGRTKAAEGFAEAYALLTEKGIDYRFPNTNKEKVSYNLLLDHVADVIKRQNLTGFKDFGSNIKFDSYSEGKTPDLEGARLSALVGGFQSAIDRYKGNKKEYIKKMSSNEQLKNDIVEYINKTQLPFAMNSAKPDEINFALQYITRSSNQKKDESKILEDLKTGKMVKKKTPEDKEYNFIESFRRYLPLSIKEFLDKNPHLSIKRKLNRTDYIGKINLSFQNDPRVPVSDDQYYIGKNIIAYLTSEKMIPEEDYLGEARYIVLLEKLIQNIFPDLNFNNSEDYLYYDFHQNKNGSFVLDLESVRQKVVQAVNSYVHYKKLDEVQKNKIINDLMVAIQNYSNSTRELINQYETGNTGKFISNQFNAFLNRRDNLPLAKKAVDKLFLSKIPRKNILFMRIYNNSKLSEGQKQELLNYYKAKQTQVGK